jgi:hypothetical protein
MMAANSRRPDVDVDEIQPRWIQYFETLKQHVSNVYMVDSDDAEIAVEVLVAFFSIKSINQKQHLILPQIADWAWHEFILDTENYAEFCDAHFGRYLHHVKSRRTKSAAKFLDNQFEFSSCLFRDRRQIAADHFIWSDAGWKNPKYRMRSNVEFNSQKPINSKDISPTVAALDLGWIACRIQERYGVSSAQARHVLAAYRVFLSIRCRNAYDQPPSDIYDIAWREHILSTVKYHRDCDRLFGSYLHRLGRRAIA